MTTLFLYAITATGSGIGFVAQSLISGYWSRAFGDDALHFSLNTAVYLLNIAVSSLLASGWRAPTLGLLLTLTLALSCLAGISIPILKLGIVHLENFSFLPLALVSLLGILAGQLIPLALRLRTHVGSLNVRTLLVINSSSVIVFTLLFTFGCLGTLGFGKTALWLATVPSAAAIILFFILEKPERRSLLVRVLLVAIPWLGHLAIRVESPATLDGAFVVLSSQSPLQKIVLTERRGTFPSFPNLPQHDLYLGSSLLFSSLTEQVQYACLVNVPRAALENSGRTVKHALVLGGGDGLAARNLLSSPKIQTITVIEPDAAVARLGREERRLRMYNLDSTRDPKVKTVIADVFDWMKRADSKYDLVVISFPITEGIALARLFSGEFYGEVFRLLSPQGAVAVLAGPTSSTAVSFIQRSIQSTGYTPVVYTSTRTNAAFILSSNGAQDIKKFFAKAGMIPKPHEPMTSLCQHDPSRREGLPPVQPFLAQLKAPPALLLPD